MRPRISPHEAAMVAYNAAIVLKSDRELFETKNKRYLELDKAIKDIRTRMQLTPSVVVTEHLADKKKEHAALVPVLNMLQRRIRYNDLILQKYKAICLNAKQNHRGRYKEAFRLSDVIPSHRPTAKDLSLPA